MRRILVVSDTHGNNAALRQLIRKENPLSMLIFCGDGAGALPEIRELLPADCEIHAVRGNNDISSDLPLEEEFMLGPYRVMLCHGHRYGVSVSPERLCEEAYARGCSLVFFGHTHVPMIREFCGVTAVNPGSLAYPRQADRRPAFVLIEQEENGRLHFHEGRI